MSHHFTPPLSSISIIIKDHQSKNCLKTEKEATIFVEELNIILFILKEKVVKDSMLN